MPDRWNDAVELIERVLRSESPARHRALDLLAQGFVKINILE
jgi:hypothetical protein